MSGRKLTTAVTLVALLLVVIGMAAFGYKQLTAPLPDPPSAEEKCTGAEKEVQGYLRRKQVQVSVFNAGNREGFAGLTLEKIVNAGFRAGNAGNAPKSAEIRRAIVWTTEENDPAAKLVAQALGRAYAGRDHQDRPRPGHRRDRRQPVQGRGPQGTQADPAGRPRREVRAGRLRR